MPQKKSQASQPTPTKPWHILDNFRRFPCSPLRLIQDIHRSTLGWDRKRKTAMTPGFHNRKGTVRSGDRLPSFDGWFGFEPLVFSGKKQLWHQNGDIFSTTGRELWRSGRPCFKLVRVGLVEDSSHKCLLEVGFSHKAKMLAASLDASWCFRQFGRFGQNEWRSGDRPAWRDSGSESQSGIREPQSQFRDWGFGIRIPKRDSRIPIPISGFGIRMPKRDSRIPIPISGFGIRDSNPQTGVANPNPNFGIRDSNPKAGVANPNPNFGIRDSNPKAGFANPNPNFGIRDSGFGIRDSNPKTGVVNLNPNFGIRDSNPKAGFANPESQFWDSGFECQSGIREPQSQFRDSGFGIRDSNPKAGFASPNSGFGIRDLGLANPHPDFGIWDSNPKARFC